MRKSYASKSSNGVEPVTEVGQIPLVLIQAQASLSDAATVNLDAEYRLEQVNRAQSLIDSVLKYIAKGECDLAELKPEAAHDATIASR